MERKQDRPYSSGGDQQQVSNAGPTCSLPDSTAYGDEVSGSLREGPRLRRFAAYRKTVFAGWLRKRELSLDLQPSRNLKTGPHFAVVDFCDHVAAEAAVTLKL
jgi:hypothetical protein